MDDRALRALTLIDACTRNCPVIEVDVSLGGARVVAVFDRLRVSHGLQRRITEDEGREFPEQGAQCVGASARRAAPVRSAGKPVDGTFIEAFNSRCATSA